MIEYISKMRVYPLRQDYANAAAGETSLSNDIPGKPVNQKEVWTPCQNKM